MRISAHLEFQAISGQAGLPAQDALARGPLGASFGFFRVKRGGHDGQAVARGAHLAERFAAGRNVGVQVDILKPMA